MAESVTCPATSAPPQDVRPAAQGAGLASRWRAALLSLCAALLLTAAAPSSAQEGGFSAGARAYARQDYSRAAVILVPLAEHGDPWAPTYLGFMYLHGPGGPQNFDAASHLFRLP